MIERLSKEIKEGGAPPEEASGELPALAKKIERLRGILSDLRPVLEPAGPSHPPVPEARQ
jgi:hypothetical protein